jgi:hypothetical protein
MSIQKIKKFPDRQGECVKMTHFATLPLSFLSKKNALTRPTTPPNPEKLKDFY